uniref:Acyltransferase C-terminal domain-containing protein n=1 Tax=Trichogramma kaykai TaxID=54128 RepID=A0ABD2WXD4_9HYME
MSAADAETARDDDTVAAEKNWPRSRQRIKAAFHISLMYLSTVSAFAFFACPLYWTLLVYPPLYHRIIEWIVSYWELYPVVSANGHLRAESLGFGRSHSSDGAGDSDHEPSHRGRLDVLVVRHVSGLLAKSRRSQAKIHPQRAIETHTRTSAIGRRTGGAWRARSATCPSAVPPVSCCSFPRAPRTTRAPSDRRTLTLPRWACRSIVAFCIPARRDSASWLGIARSAPISTRSTTSPSRIPISCRRFLGVEFLNGKLPKVIHFNVVRIGKDQLPTNEEDLKTWLEERWRLKERQLDKFDKYKKFDSEIWPEPKERAPLVAALIFWTLCSTLLVTLLATSFYFRLWLLGWSILCFSASYWTSGLDRLQIQWDFAWTSFVTRNKRRHRRE